MPTAAGAAALRCAPVRSRRAGPCHRTYRGRRTRPTRRRSCRRSRPTRSPTACRAGAARPRGAARSPRAPSRPVSPPTRSTRSVTTAYIARGGYPSTLDYKGYPKSLCTSVNEVICHGIPDDRAARKTATSSTATSPSTCTVCTATAARRSSSATSTTRPPAGAGDLRVHVARDRGGEAGRPDLRDRPGDPVARREERIRRGPRASSATASASCSTPRLRCRTSTTRTPTRS